MRERLRRRLRSGSAARGAVRLAVAVLVTDVVAHGWFTSTTAAVLASFAVLIHCYFLDFDGDLRERAVGHGAATVVGLVAVTLGTTLATPLARAVGAALVVSAVFAFGRLLRGYVARSAVGLQVAFFIPLFAAPGVAELPNLLAAWVLGSAIATTVALALLPHRRSGRVRRALAEWLDAAAGLGRALVDRAPLDDPREQMRRAFADLTATSGEPALRPGAVGHRTRALDQMVERAQWAMPIVERIRELPPDADTTLLAVSADALTVAADAVGGGPLPATVPDVPEARERDFARLGEDPSRDRIRDHTLVRVYSIAAATQLWLAGRSRGRAWPVPDFGSVADGRPVALVRAGLRTDSVWLRNALRTGVAVAGCVLLVRQLGLQQGLWVVMAALLCINQTFSAPAIGRSLVGITVGASVGVGLAGALFALHPPRPWFVVALPLVAAAAKLTQARGSFWAQVTFTPFALVNLAVLSWPLPSGLVAVRVVDVVVGALVAAGLTVLVFPYGLARRIAVDEQAATDATTRYFRRAVAAARGGDPAGLDDDRAAGVEAISALAQTLDAATVHAERGDRVREGRRSLALDRDRLTGGDVCTDLARRRRHDPHLAVVAAAFADWWEQVLTGPRTD